ncbi:MAG: hypothetical protein KME35_17265 [Aphanocapsa sp. GSE-SYN-MK-11-07L]|nr:hypothetical protein [Aphanocapsa sp. GSE-SYN-MK-11-07L]
MATFKAYTQAFETLDPHRVEPFFHQPAVLITSAKVSLMSNSEEIKRVFWILFADLTLKDFKCSKIDAIRAKQVSENQAIVSGVATRYDRSNQVLDRFGLNYTLRKADRNWKIVVAVLHDYW